MEKYNYNHELVIQMLKAYKKGDKDLNQFPDSVEKEVLIFNCEDALSISDIKLALDNAETEIEKTKIILSVLTKPLKVDSVELKILSEYKDLRDLLDKIRKINAIYMKV